ncbi:hypothetical protein EDB92DRAFT_1899322 [Lactarius akahatsu]|uniref:Calcium channel YVC1-like C-terminal transmembrane domain-containing protein n=1 Tax=Lactarius akahatsu TaxID=416441 RepID=A0AAD4Q8K2_9AGAM|nr:hypothetical protein EDB92DRAFT_1899322 [Lactarius akahatsu]
MKLVHHFASNQIELVSVLITNWSPLAGATNDVIEDVKNILGNNEDQSEVDLQSALEVAISSSAKRFVASPIVQSVVNDIYSGRVIYSSSANRSIVADNYKLRAIEIYNGRNAPWLNHYRLRVPRYGAILEFLNFACLLVTFILCLFYKDLNTPNAFEVLFIVFAAAFALEEYTASVEHGWSVYFANMWNIFDSTFIVVTTLYLVLRVKGLSSGDNSTSELGFDILACGACIIFPRLAFFMVSNNVVIFALRAMTAEFVFFMGIAATCFSGLLFTLWMLGSEQWTLRSIAWLMVQIWFGNTYLSFGQASSFHPFFGPILMVGFAALSNTLLLTILISILSNTFTRIDANANQEFLFQFTITTLEGMKSDALFSYQPPFNLLAFAVLLPASWVLTPRSLHSANVFLIRLTSFPVLVTISLYERYLLTHFSIHESAQLMAQSIYNTLPRHVRSLPFFEAFMGTNMHDLYGAIFDVEPDLTEDDGELFTDREQDRVGLHSWTSRESGGADTRTPPPTLQSLHELSTPEGPVRASRRASSLPRSRQGQSGGSPRIRKLSLRPSLAEPHRMSAAEAQNVGLLTPLARLFSNRLSESDPSGAAASPVDSQKLVRVEEGVRRVQELLEDVRELPVSKLKDEMRELQERQARIESLLLMLTRGMRNEAGSATAPSRHDTL